MHWGSLSCSTQRGQPSMLCGGGEGAGIDLKISAAIGTMPRPSFLLWSSICEVHFTVTSAVLYPVGHPSIDGYQMRNPKTQYTQSKAGQGLAKIYSQGSLFSLELLERGLQCEWVVSRAERQPKQQQQQLGAAGPGPGVPGFQASPSILSSPSVSSLRLNPGPPHPGCGWITL